MAPRRPPAHPARRRLAGPRRHRCRAVRRRRGVVEGVPRAGGRPRAPGRGQLRQRLLRRGPRHRRRPRRADAPGRLGGCDPGRCQGRRVPLLRGRRGGGAGAGRDHRVVAGGGRAALRARRLVLHRRLEALRLPRARRGDGVLLLRPGGRDRHDVRPDRDLAPGFPVRRDRDRLHRLRDPGGQQPPRHPHRPGARARSPSRSGSATVVPGRSTCSCSTSPCWPPSPSR